MVLLLPSASHSRFSCFCKVRVALSCLLMRIVKHGGPCTNMSEAVRDVWHANVASTGLRGLEFLQQQRKTLWAESVAAVQ